MICYLYSSILNLSNSIKKPQHFPLLLKTVIKITRYAPGTREGSPSEEMLQMHTYSGTRNRKNHEQSS